MYLENKHSDVKHFKKNIVVKLKKKPRIDKKNSEQIHVFKYLSKGSN